MEEGPLPVEEELLQMVVGLLRSRVLLLQPGVELPYTEELMRVGNQITELEVAEGGEELRLFPEEEKGEMKITRGWM